MSDRQHKRCQEEQDQVPALMTAKSTGGEIQQMSNRSCISGGCVCTKESKAEAGQRGGELSGKASLRS